MTVAAAVKKIERLYKDFRISNESNEDGLSYSSSESSGSETNGFFDYGPDPIIDQNQELDLLEQDTRELVKNLVYNLFFFIITIFLAIFFTNFLNEFN